MREKRNYNVRKRITKNPARILSNPIKLAKNLSINDTRYIENYLFKCGNDVPVFEVFSVHGLNQLIGYAKFINQAYGNVYYRGECKLHDSLKPSLFRNVKNTEKSTERLSKLIKKLYSDQYMKKGLKISAHDFELETHRIEVMLQHYGIATRFLDVVDNHWVSLWMGLNHTERLKQRNQYYHYSERSIPYIDMIKDESNAETSLYQYILLIAIPYIRNQSLTGISISDNFIEVDLRQALPSIFLRPHAQHGLVVRKKVHDSDTAKGVDGYDMASSVIGILKIRIDRVAQWLGTGDLLTQSNLFPPAGYDYGYDVLLSRSDLFDDSGFSVAKYV